MPLEPKSGQQAGLKRQVEVITDNIRRRHQFNCRFNLNVWMAQREKVVALTS